MTRIMKVLLLGYRKSQTSEEQCGVRTNHIGRELDVKLLAEADLARHRIVHDAAFTEPMGSSFHAMLEATVNAANAATFAVAYSCGYRHVIDHTGIVFNPIKESKTP